MALPLSTLQTVTRHGRLAVARPSFGAPLSPTFFSTSTASKGRVRPVLALARPKRPLQQQQQQQQEVLPPTKSNPSSSDPSLHRVTPLGKNQPHQRPQRHDYYERPQHERGHGHEQQRRPGFNPWLFHILQSKRAAVRAFFTGSVITVAGVSVYNYSTSPSVSLSEWFSQATQLDYSQVRASLASSAGPSAKGSPEGLTFHPYSPFSGGPLFEKQLKMLSSEQVEEKLAQNEKSFRIATKEGERRNKSKQDLIVGYCVNQVASNHPIEDDLSRHVVRGKDGEIEKAFFGVFDGHGGWCCSQKVAQDLAPSLALELKNVKDPHDIMAVMEAIENGFVKLDDRIVKESVERVLEFPSRPLACSSLLPAIMGSCAIMAYIDTKEKDLYVACTGDSRAVLGVCEPSLTKKGGHSWKAVPLSFDQTGRNRWEVRRLQKEHPGEEDTVVMRGRVLGGLEPTRAFGDARYKWTADIQERVFQLFPSIRQPYRNFHTPPYVTAKPVVKHHKIGPEDRFLVLATDGLWDKLTSDEVIQLVGDLLDGKTGQEKLVLDRDELKRIKDKVDSVKSIITGKKGDQTEEEEELTPTNMVPKGPSNQVRQFTFKDYSNASTHLVRNALGGGDDERLAATLSIPAPMSRVYRDDITVTVIFFGSQDTKTALSDAQGTGGFVEIV